MSKIPIANKCPMNRLDDYGSETARKKRGAEFAGCSSVKSKVPLAEVMLVKIGDQAVRLAENWTTQVRFGPPDKCN